MKDLPQWNVDQSGLNMAALSDTFENKLLDWLFRGQALGLTGASAAAGSGFTTVYVGLYTVMPTDAAAGTEVSTTSTGYARVAVTCNLTNWSGTQGAGTTVASTGTLGTIYNNIAITFGAPTAAWGTVVGFGLFDAATAGNRILYGTLGASTAVNLGDPAPSFAAGALSIQIDN